ncbi:MAG: S8 family peptidase [Bacteroidia bacterium]
MGSHGTACAGIVAAEGDNAQGVSGVAPSCGIMSISNSLQGNPTSRQARADGIIWAYTNGAAVISNSWSSSVAYAVIDDAISDAQTLGRGGLGTVIVFAAGNDNASSVSYPANSNDDVIAVGAMSPCGERKNPSSCDGESWGSNYGTDLDVVAPGVKIPTTDRQSTNGYNTSAGTAGDYTQTFNGTSSACPHVAGLAGLLISMNPCLSQRQVCDIIEKTAQKTGSYTYSTTVGRDNGTWNNEMGYGLIDADAAMRMTRELYIQNMTITTARVFEVHGEIFAGNNVDPNQTAGDVILNAGADVDFLATTGITLDPGFTVNVGAIFDADIVTTNCTDWNVNADFFRHANPAVTTVTEGGAGVPPMTARVERNFSVRPNPFSQQLTVDYTITKPGPTSIQLYDLQGKVVKRLNLNDGQTAGMHREVIDLDTALPAGVYFLRMELNGDSHIQKLVKQ